MLAAVATAVPVVVWGAAAAVPEPPIDCTAAENAEDPTLRRGCTGPGGRARGVRDVAAATAPAATVPTTAAPTSTTAPGGAAETTDPATPTTTTTVDPAATTTTTPAVDPSATTTTTTPAVDPNATTTTTTPAVDPNATTTTVVDPNAATATTVPPPPPEDLDSDPVLPPVEAPAGRVVLPAGAVDTGMTRPITFPVAGPVTYFNDWGACRDGCARAHKGNDLIGDRLQPLLAMHDGVVNRVLDHPTAGFGIVVRDDEGWEYHLYHVNNDTPGTDDGADDGTWRFATGVAPGVRVRAGDVLAWMGDSGNAEGSVPHAHVELHRPDGAAINPYWSLRQAQRDVNCAVVALPDPAQPALDQPAPGRRSAGPGPSSSGSGPGATGSGPTRRGANRRVPSRSAAPIDPAAAVDADWLATGWAAATLPGGWQPLSLTGGAPGSGVTAARMWISPGGFTPVDGAALRAGDPRYDSGVDCTLPSEPQVDSPIPAELGAILSTIKAMESGGDYTVAAATSTASGAYQFLDSSWGSYGGYARAKDAPPAVQDAKAAEMAASILARNGGDVSTVPVSWYLGHVPVGAEWDTVPRVPGQPAHAAGVPGPLDEALRPTPRHSRGLGRHDAGVLAGGGHLGHVPHRRRRRRSGRGAAVRADPGSGLRHASRPAGPCPAPSIRAIRRGRWSHRHRWSSGRWCGSPDRPDHSRRGSSDRRLRRSPSSRGRPDTVPPMSGSHSFGIDIGGSGMKAAPVDLATGELLAERHKILTPKPATPERMAEVVAELVGHFGWNDPLGVAFPGVVRTGVIYSAANVDPSWIGTDSDALFSKASGVEVHVVNDADAAGLAELRYGAGRDHPGTVIVLTFGTGIGSGLFRKGLLVPNTELGHLEIDGQDAELRAAAAPGTVRASDGRSGRRVSSTTCGRSRSCSRRT